MNEYEKKRTGLLHATDELRQLILENPELPLLVFAGEDCNSGDYSFRGIIPPAWIVGHKRTGEQP